MTTTRQKKTRRTVDHLQANHLTQNLEPNTKLKHLLKNRKDPNNCAAFNSHLREIVTEGEQRVQRSDPQLRNMKLPRKTHTNTPRYSPNSSPNPKPSKSINQSPPRSKTPRSHQPHTKLPDPRNSPSPRSPCT